MPAILSPNVRVSFVGIPFFFLLSFSLFFFADDTDHDTLATNLVHPSLPSLSPVSRVSYATEEAIVGSSAMFRYLIPEHFFSETGVFQKRHSSSSSSSSCHCSARGSFTKLRLCSVTLSAAQTCPPGESTASSLNFIKKKFIRRVAIFRISFNGVFFF